MAEYTLGKIKELAANAPGRTMELTLNEDTGSGKLMIALEPSNSWFLSVFIAPDCGVSYRIDCEAADDSHYLFEGESAIRDLLYKKGDEELYLHEIFRQYIKKHKGRGDSLISFLHPFITEQYHFASFGD